MPSAPDTQWRIIKDSPEDPDPSPEGGRPRVEARACLEGILWMLRNGARWQDLPVSIYPLRPDGGDTKHGPKLGYRPKHEVV
jgi:transposase